MVNSEELKLRAESETEKKSQEEEVEVEEMNENKKKKMMKMDGERLIVRWEKLLPRMTLRVMLVEADDSTRQIIAALLRKCSYKVVAVQDGLKAWEMLKGRSCNIDLILTEVDLPLISGYALLTLIMEHEICKNIPVIMMSSQDSVSTVYKCMLRGAADYLVKPIRRNELRNLWQHVWRRQSSIGGVYVPQEESVGQDKTEAISENNASSNRSGGYVIKEVEKENDSQSSCTKPDVEAEHLPMENMRDFFQAANRKSLPIDKRMQKHEAQMDSGQMLLTHESGAGGSATATCKNSNKMIVDDGVELGTERTNIKIIHQGRENSHLYVNSSREAIDFMGESASHNSSLTNNNRNFDFVPQLDHYLRRCHPSGSVLQVQEDRCTLRHSRGSAFTRYSSQPLQSARKVQGTVSNQKELGDYTERKFSTNICGYNSDAPGPPPSFERVIVSPASGQTKGSEVESSSSQRRGITIQNPVNGVGYNNLCASYGSMFSPIICKQSGPSPTPSPSSASQPDPNCKLNPFQHFNFRNNCENIYDQLAQTNDTINQSLQNQDRKLDFRDDREHISPTTDQSATSTLCNGTVSHMNMGYGSTSGSNSNIDHIANTRVPAEGKFEESVLQKANSHRSIQREVALTKFRLKRKDRCYEKKVRYESRKKLAEQRPRVKGQFVRQVQPPSTENQ